MKYITEIRSTCLQSQFICILTVHKENKTNHEFPLGAQKMFVMNISCSQTEPQKLYLYKTLEMHSFQLLF